MAVAFDAVGPSSAGVGSDTSPLTWSHTCGANATLLLVGISVGSTVAGNPATVTYGGTAMTKLGAVNSNNQTDGHVEMWGLLNPTPGTATVSVSATTVNPNQWLLGGSVSYTGSSSTTLPTATTAFGSGATPSVTISSATGNMVASAQVVGSQFIGNNGTLRYQLNQNFVTAAGNLQYNDDAGATSVTLTGTAASDWWGIVGVDIPAAPPPPTFVASASNGESFSSTRTITKPVGVSAGDLAVFHVHRWNASNSFPAPSSLPSGAVQVGSSVSSDSTTTSSGGFFETRLYAVYVAAESSYVFNFTATYWSRVEAHFWTGVASGVNLTTLPVDIQTASASTTIPAVTVSTAAGNGLSWFCNSGAYDGGETHTPATGYTESLDDQSASDGRKIATVASETASGGTISFSETTIASLVAIPTAGGGGGSGTTVAWVVN